MIFSSNKFDRFHLQDTILRKNNISNRIETEPSTVNSFSKRDEKFQLMSPTNSISNNKGKHEMNYSFNKPIRSFEELTKLKKTNTISSRDHTNINDSSILLYRREFFEKESPNTTKHDTNSLIEGYKKNQVQSDPSKKGYSSSSLILPKINYRSPRNEEQKRIKIRPFEETPIEEIQEQSTAKFMNHLRFLSSKNCMKTSNFFGKKKGNISLSSSESDSDEDSLEVVNMEIHADEKNTKNTKKSPDSNNPASVNTSAKKNKNAMRRGLINPEAGFFKRNNPDDPSRRVGITAVRESQNIVKALRKSEIGIYNEIYSVTRDLSANIEMMNNDVSNKRKSFLLMKKFLGGLHGDIREAFLDQKKEELIEPITQETLENICFIKEPYTEGAFVFYKESFDKVRLNDFKELNKRVTEFNIKRKIEELRNMERQITEEFVEVKRIEEEMRKKDVKRFLERYRPITRLKYQSMGAGQKLINEIEEFEVHYGDINVVPQRGRSISKELDSILYSVTNKLKHVT